MGIGDADAHDSLFTRVYDELKRLAHLRKRIWQVAHPDVASAHFNLGEVHARRGQFELAVRQFQQALDMYRERPGPAHPLTLRAATQLGRVLHSAGNDTRAASLLEWVIEVGSPARLPAQDTTLAAARRLLQEIKPATLE